MAQNFELSVTELSARIDAGDLPSDHEIKQLIAFRNTPYAHAVVKALSARVALLRGRADTPKVRVRVFTGDRS